MITQLYTNGSGSFPFYKDVFITISIAGVLKKIGAVFNSRAPGLTPVFLLFFCLLFSYCPFCSSFMLPRRSRGGGGGILIYPLSVRSSVRIQIHGLSGYLLQQDFYTHNGGVHVHRILIFIKYSQNDRQLDLVILFVRPDIDTSFVRLSPPTVLELQL